MSGFMDDEDDEDMYEVGDEADDEENLSADAASGVFKKAGQLPQQVNQAVKHVQQVSAASQLAAAKRDREQKRAIRIRPMSNKMRAKHPTAVSITITHTDGRQVVFAR